MSRSRLILGKGKVSNIISGDSDIVLSRESCDINAVSNIEKVIKNFKPEVIINCAAKTNLEYCQENKLEAFKSNASGVMNLLDCCSRYNIKLVHISSGCLFDGNESISTEDSKPTPAVWYTWTKKWADEIITSYGYENYLILRPRQLISAVPHPSNMLSKFANMEKIGAINEPNSLTCIEDFKLMIDHLLDINATGIFNCANPGIVSPLDIAMGVKEYINPELGVEEISYEDLLDILPNRRVNTVLSIDKLLDTGFKPRTGKEALLWCLSNYDKSL